MQTVASRPDYIAGGPTGLWVLSQAISSLNPASSSGASRPILAAAPTTVQQSNLGELPVIFLGRTGVHGRAEFDGEGIAFASGEDEYWLKLLCMQFDPADPSAIRGPSGDPEEA